MKRNCIVTSIDPGGISGGNKAKADIEKFCKELKNFDSFHILEYSKKEPIKKLVYSNITLRSQIKKKYYDNYIIQYPVRDNYAFKKYMHYVFKFRKRNVFFIIHDIKSLQNNDINQQEKEINLFNKTQGLIVHNKYMKKWLVEHGVNTNITILGVFDYDNPQPFQKEQIYKGTICFPGNLYKSTFLRQPFLNEHILNIYGPNKLKKYPKNIVYKGQYSPEELPKHLYENFGLIWDGISPKSCEGKFGKYLKYNNPHKLSLFISSGIPVIVWDKSAVADIVKKYKIGIVIDSLYNLDKILNSVTEDQYKILKNNTEELGKKLRKGFCIKEALRNMLDEN
ncbi:beta-1,6-galactofuranosyltransferase [Lactobacillus acidophilus]|uniref:beta-1,6-galactofuranosyltransferase n=1 Tax=Lactobacillus acidophilus TaxID=1579 RepID=UPI0021A752D6|nr:beta-1,6-galactofuranosyltransferase [Lactobacillus acidophilus]MCT3602864.1 beta-1,6-galactofuranosyltransferase [Lactobacillus acidophilus]MCT3623324.1 beta-1,6-galactofuranosyltransferase [Lactobacillus acidophilus]